MRVEYAKSRARALRWSEEVTLVKEEMRRVLEFLNWKIGWWMARANSLASRTDSLAVGFMVYANRQAILLERIGLRFKKQWEEECSMKNLPDIGGIPLAFISSVA